MGGNGSTVATARRRPFLRSVLVLPVLWVALSFAAATPASGASVPCWRSVINDWSVGGLDREHSIGCYRAALKRLPSDIRTYTTAEDDIQRALLQAIRNGR